LRGGSCWMASARVYLLTFGLLCGPGIGTAAAYCRLTTEMPKRNEPCASTGVGLAWKRSCISFSLTKRSDPLPPLEMIRDVTDTSFRTWNRVTCDGEPLALELSETEQLGKCETPEYNKRSANANTVIFLKDWDERDLPSDAFGLTLVWHNPDSGEIYDADMQINESLGSLAICRGSCARGEVDLQNVVTHEAGHFLGLGHSDVSSATMASRATVGEIKKRDLDDDDREGLCEIYGDYAEAACETVDFTPDRGFSSQCTPEPEGDEAESEGCRVAAGSRGRALPDALLGAGVLLLMLRARRRGER
jgi:hypothetical protein